MTKNNGNARWLKETDNVDFRIGTSICRKEALETNEALIEFV